MIQRVFSRFPFLVNLKNMLYTRLHNVYNPPHRFPAMMKRNQLMGNLMKRVPDLQGGRVSEIGEEAYSYGVAIIEFVRNR